MLRVLKVQLLSDKTSASHKSGCSDTSLSSSKSNSKTSQSRTSKNGKAYDSQGNMLEPDAAREEQKYYEMQGKPYTLKWVDKNEGDKVRPRVVVQEIKQAKSEQ
eukprot:2869805-Amphidinium_carterae.3